MNDKKEVFMMEVMASAIVRDIRDGRNVAASVIGCIAEIDRSKIPDEYMSDAVMDYIAYQYQTSPPGDKIPEPEWLKS